MTLDDLDNYRKRLRCHSLKNSLFLVSLAAALTLLWIWSGLGASEDERALMRTVRASHAYLYKLRISAQSDFREEDDPWHTGLIGLEWSPITTTLGALEAKRTSCDPRWSVVVRKWVEGLGVMPGDCVAVYSSSSFPGMAVNVIMALESLKVRPLLIVSLGSSTWGANDPKFPWPILEKELRKGGFIKTASFAYTLGGDNELGGGMDPEEGIALLRAAAEAAGVEVMPWDSLESVINGKVSLLQKSGAKALINIGGSASNLGSDDAVIKLSPGLHRSGNGGNGVIGRALELGYPVIHLLNMKGLCAQAGVPYDASPGYLLYGKRRGVACAAGFAIFALVLVFYRRWDIPPSE